MAKISILGAGGFGIALAIHAEKCGHEVVVWSAFEQEINALVRDGEHKKLLPGVKISDNIKLTTDLSVIKDSDIVLYAVPSKVLRNVAQTAKQYIDEKSIIVNVGKGIEEGTYKRLSEVLSEENPVNPIVIISGPSHAEEVGRGVPTTVLAASENKTAAEYVQKELSNSLFRIYDSDDIIGCEFGGSLKNAIALSAGICDGIGYGDNTKAALMTRGIAEIARLGTALGGKPETFYGLSGIGDLIVTCTSMHSRNRRAGILIGEGVSPDEAVAQIGTVEGYGCAKVAYELAKKVNVNMPIINELYDVLYNGADSKKSVEVLMNRPHKSES